jgi:hypothetical protein
MRGAESQPRPRKKTARLTAVDSRDTRAPDEPAIELLDKLSDGADGFTHGLAALSSVSVGELSHTVPVA